MQDYYLWTNWSVSLIIHGLALFSDESQIGFCVDLPADVVLGAVILVRLIRLLLLLGSVFDYGMGLFFALPAILVTHHLFALRLCQQE
jgi:hypothetical protein